MSYHNTYLQDVLESIVPGDLDDWIYDEMDEMIETLKQIFPGRNMRAGNPFFSGSWKKNTEVAGYFDLDIIVPFRQSAFKGKNIMEKLKAMRNHVFKTIESCFQSDNDVKVRQQRFSVGITIYGEGEDDVIHFDIVPGLECVAGGYSDDQGFEELDLYLFGYLKRTKKSPEIASKVRTNLARQFEILGNLGEWREIVRLLKYWRKARNQARPNSYPIELMVLMAMKKAPKDLGNGLGDRMEYVLGWMHEFLRNPNNQLVDVGSNAELKDFLRKTERPHIANQFKNMRKRLIADEDGKWVEWYFPLREEY